MIKVVHLFFPTVRMFQNAVMRQDEDILQFVSYASNLITKVKISIAFLQKRFRVFNKYTECNEVLNNTISVITNYFPKNR